MGAVMKVFMKKSALVLLATALGCGTAVTSSPALRNVAPRTLGFKGRLAGEARAGLPASVAAALDPTSDTVFAYDERVTHVHDELPPVLIVLVTATFHLFGLPIGHDEATAKAELIITRRDREIGRYRAEATSSHTYGLYYGGDIPKLEAEARTTVRRVIDEALADDMSRLTERVATPQS